MLQLPEIKVIAPAPERSGLPPVTLGGSCHCAGVITGEELRQSGSNDFAGVLDATSPVLAVERPEQGNAVQPGISLRGFRGTPVTGVSAQGMRRSSSTVVRLELSRAVEETQLRRLSPRTTLSAGGLSRSGGPSAIFGRNTLGGSSNIRDVAGCGEAGDRPRVGRGSFGTQQYRLRLGGTEGYIDYYSRRLSLPRQDLAGGTASATRLGKGFREGWCNALRGHRRTTLSFLYGDNRIEQPGSLPLSLLRQDRTLNFTGGDFFQPPRVPLDTQLRARSRGPGCALEVSLARTLAGC